MADERKGKLPGNHGQFGEDAATEEYRRLDDPAPDPSGNQTPAETPGGTQTDAGERS